MRKESVIVVGAGFAGLSVACHLSDTHRVTVIDRAKRACSEASAHGAGMVRRLGEDPFERVLALRTAEWLAQLDDSWGPSSPSRVTGAFIGLCHDPSHLNDAVAHLRARGIRVDNATDRAPIRAPAAAGATVCQGWWLPDERTVDLRALAQGMRRHLEQRDGRVLTGVDVLALHGDQDRICGVQTRDAVLLTDHVILATGAWADHAPGDPAVDVPVRPLRRTLIETDPHPLASDDHPWVWLDDIGLYARPRAGRWLLSACEECDEARPVPYPSRGPLTEEAARRIRTRLDAYLPALRDCRFSSGWSGLRTFAPDRRPVLGKDPRFPGLWWAVGMGGSGVSMCAGVGQALAAWINGDETPWLRPEHVAPQRDVPRRWPIRPTGDLRESVLVDSAIRGPAAPLHAA